MNMSSYLLAVKSGLCLVVTPLIFRFSNLFFFLWKVPVQEIAIFGSLKRILYMKTQLVHNVNKNITGFVYGKRLTVL